MNLIDTRTHGFLDYAMGLLLIACPFLFALSGDGAESIILYILGSGAILYSLFTDYELGVVKKLPMNLHLCLDIFSGILLAVSPWLFAFAGRTFLPHVILGVIEIAAAFATNTGKHSSTRLI